jgi:hypothetical protein
MARAGAGPAAQCFVLKRVHTEKVARRRRAENSEASGPSFRGPSRGSSARRRARYSGSYARFGASQRSTSATGSPFRLAYASTWSRPIRPTEK